MKMINIDGQWQEVEVVQFQALDRHRVAARYSGNTTIMSVRDAKDAWNHVRKEWFGLEGFTVREGVFWAAFLEYLFPIALDIAKVYCAIMVCQAFYKERVGGSGDGKTGVQALVHYGKFYILFTLIPWFVELIDEIGHKMSTELHSKSVYSNNPK